MELDSARSSAIKKTYMLLSMSVLSALIGGSIGSSSPAMVQFFGEEEVSGKMGKEMGWLAWKFFIY